MEQVKDLFGYHSLKDADMKEAQAEPQQEDNLAIVVWKF